MLLFVELAVSSASLVFLASGAEEEMRRQCAFTVHLTCWRKRYAAGADWINMSSHCRCELARA